MVALSESYPLVKQWFLIFCAFSNKIVFLNKILHGPPINKTSKSRAPLVELGVG